MPLADLTRNERLKVDDYLIGRFPKGKNVNNKEFERYVSELSDDEAIELQELLSDPSIRVTPITSGTGEFRNGYRISNRVASLSFTPTLKHGPRVYVNNEPFVLKDELRDLPLKDILTVQLGSVDKLRESIDIEATKKEIAFNHRGYNTDSLRNFDNEDDLKKQDREILLNAARAGRMMRRKELGLDLEMGKEHFDMDDVRYAAKKEFVKAFPNFNRTSMKNHLDVLVGHSPFLSVDMLLNEIITQPDYVEDADLVDFLFEKSQYRDEFVANFKQVTQLPESWVN